MDLPSIDALKLKPTFGATFRRLSVEDVVRQFGPRLSTPSFYLSALGDVTAQTPDRLREHMTEDLDVAAWAVASGPAHLQGATLFVTSITTLVMAYVELPGGYEPQAFCEGLMTAAQAAFEANPRIEWVMTALPSPPPTSAEDDLSAWGFERILSGTDPLGTTTFGIRREVAAAVLSEL